MNIIHGENGVLIMKPKIRKFNLIENNKIRKMKRICMKNYRDYSWKSNPNAVYIGRGRGERGKWGNPFKVKDWGREICLELYREWLKKKLKEKPNFLEPLRGKDLVCFCPIIKDGKYCDCHGDILISMANNITMEEVKNENIKAYYGNKI